jgi:hypothetical protein
MSMPSLRQRLIGGRSRRGTRRILAISRTVEGLGAGLREPMEGIHSVSKSSSNKVNLWPFKRLSVYLCGAPAGSVE